MRNKIPDKKLDLKGEHATEVTLSDENTVDDVFNNKYGLTAKDIRFVNTYAFRCVMDDKTLWEPVLSELLNTTVTVVDFRTEDYQVAVPNKTSAVRFDFYCRLEDGRNVEIELEVTRRKDIIRRARYYSSMQDVMKEDTKNGRDYSLKDSYVIFLCDHKRMPVKNIHAIRGRTRYVAARVGDSALPDSINREVSKLDDGRYIYFLDFQYYKLFSQKTRSLFSLMSGDYTVSDVYGKKLLEKFELLKADREVLRKMLEQEIDEYNIEDIIAEEREESREEGRQQGRRETVEALVRDEGWTKERAEQFYRRISGYGA